MLNNIICIYVGVKTKQSNVGMEVDKNDKAMWDGIEKLQIMFRGKN